MDQLLTRKQVALKFAVDPMTVRAWEKSGKLPVAMKINNKPRYTKESVDRLMIQSTPKTN